MHKQFLYSLLLAIVSQPLFALTLKGDIKQGAMILGQVEPNQLVRLGECELRVTDSGQFVFGIGRDELGEISLTVVSKEGAAHEHRFPIISREYKIQRINGVEQKYVSPPKEVTDRIKRDSAKVRQARKTDSDRLDFLQPFMLPAKGPISGVYGSQRVFNGVPKRPHFGLDIAGPVGTPIYAPADGVITLADPDQYYSGGLILMDHGFGISSSFLHLDKLHVKVGDTVKKGQLIADMGKSGRVTGPHLDWRINWYDVRLDPQLVLNLAQ